MNRTYTAVCQCANFGILFLWPWIVTHTIASIIDWNVRNIFRVIFIYECRSSFKNSTWVTLTDNESDIENNIFEKLFKTNDVSSIDYSSRTAIILSKKESFEIENEKFISHELIYKTKKMPKLNMTSELFATGGFRKPDVRKELFENNYERE